MPFQTHINLYICKNFEGKCNFALNDTQFMMREGQDLKCPKCHSGDIAFVKKFPSAGTGIKKSNGKTKKTILIFTAILFLTTVGWFVTPLVSTFFSTTAVQEKTDTLSNDMLPEAGKINSNSMSFSFTPKKPSGIIHTKGVIELGTAAFDAFVIKMDEQKNWEKIKSIRGRAYVGISGSEDVVKTGLRNYIGELIDFGVKGRDIHFVVSSGAHNSDTVKRIERVLMSLGYIVNVVTAKQEAEYGLRASIPEEFYDRSVFFVDIGSGKTKIAWLNADRSIGYGATWGSKYYEKDVSDDEVRSDVKLVAQNIPLERRSICFILGGVPFELANQLRQNKERYTCLKSADAYTPEGPKQQSGLTIYNQIALSTECKQFVFDWDSNFTIGFLLYGVGF